MQERERCPHCHTRARHSERVSCCSGCGVLFTSGSAWSAHRKALRCLDPVKAGLIPRAVASDPDAIGWGFPSGGYWGKA